MIEPRIAPADLGPATPYNFFIFGTMNQFNTDTEGRLAIGGQATLMNFGTATRSAGVPGGIDHALVSGTFLTYTNGTIQGDLHYNDNAVNLTSVAVTGTRFPDSTPIDFGASRAELTAFSGFLATQGPTGTVSRQGTTITLTGSPSNSLNVFDLSGSELAAARFGRLNITNVNPNSTVLVNIDGAAIDMSFINFEYNGVGGDQPFARRVLYNFYQATSMTIRGASPLGSILAPRAAVFGAPEGGHVSGTLVAESLSGNLEGHDFPFEGNLPEPPGPPREVDLALTKAVSDARPDVGEEITFTVTIINAGPGSAGDVVVSESVPAGLSLTSASPSQGSYDRNVGTWSVGSLAAGAVATLSLTGTVATCDPIANVARIVSSDPSDIDPSNNEADAVATPLQADLALTKVVDDPTPDVGETITFTATLTNAGPDTSVGVVVSDMLLSGRLEFVSAAPSRGTYDPGTGTWAVGDLAAGGSATLQVTATAVAPGIAGNRAVITSSDTFDCVPGNGAANVIVRIGQPDPPPPEQADLSLTKTSGGLTGTRGDTIFFDVTVRNAGPNDADGVVVVDLLPDGVGFVSATPSQGTYDPETGLWIVGALGNGASATLRVAALLADCDAFTNTAQIATSSLDDPDPANNSASLTLTPRQADLAISAILDDPSPGIGDGVTYRVTVTNAGPDAAGGVVVAGLLSNRLRLDVVEPGQGTVDLASRRWSVGTIPAGGSATLVLRATAISPGAGSSVVAVVEADIADCTPDNNAVRLLLTVLPPPDLALTKAVSDARPDVGGTITFVVTLGNLGSSPATGVVVSDPLPAGLEFVSAAPSRGTYDPATGSWAVGTVEPGLPQSLTIVARVIDYPALINTAAVASLNQDSDPSNNTASVTVIPQQPPSPPKPVPPQPIPPEPVPSPPVAPTRVSVLRRFGFHHQPTDLVLTFDAALDPASAEDPGNYRLVLIAHGGRLMRPIPVAGADYNPAADAVRLRFRRPLPLHFRYRIVASASGPGGLKDASGRPIDGDGDGRPGGDYVRVFGPEVLAGPNRPGVPHGRAGARAVSLGRAGRPAHAR